MAEIVSKPSNEEGYLLVKEKHYNMLWEYWIERNKRKGVGI